MRKEKRRRKRRVKIPKRSRQKSSWTMMQGQGTAMRKTITGSMM